MDDETLAFTPAVELAELIRTKQLSPVEYHARPCWSGSSALNPRVNAFAYLARGPAMDAAKRAEAALMSGERIGRLHGVPVTIKDLAITKDMPTQMRQPDLRRQPADRGHAVRAAPAGRGRDRPRQDRRHRNSAGPACRTAR